MNTSKKPPIVCVSDEDALKNGVEQSGPCTCGPD